MTLLRLVTMGVAMEDMVAMEEAMEDMEAMVEIVDMERGLLVL